MKFKIQLQKLFPMQQKLVNQSSRFNAVCMGQWAGKTTLAMDVLVASESGAISGKGNVVFISPDGKRLMWARRKVKAQIEGLIKATPSNDKIELKTGNNIYFFTPDTIPKRFPESVLIVVDDARRIENLCDLHVDCFLDSVRDTGGGIWYFSDAWGKRNDFYKLYDLGVTDPEWACWQVKSTSNPYLSPQQKNEIADASEMERRQRFEGEFFDNPIELSDAQKVIGPSERFLDWCLRLQKDGLKVDGHPFRLDNRASLHEIYGQIPCSIEEAFGKTLVLQKGAQMGLTVYELLADIYMAIKFAPCKVLMYLPGATMASYKSTERFMPIVRSIPQVHNLLGIEGKAGDGNKLTRVMPGLGSNFLFLWTSGREGGVSESFPGDVLSLDETQGMTLEQIDRVSERLSASRIKFRLFLSTPLWPEQDINAWYLQGDQRKFHTNCKCHDGSILTDMFLQAALSNTGKIPIIFNSGQYPDAPKDYVYYCPECGEYIEDTQAGHWVPHNPGSPITSYHMSQILSPTITAREIITAWGRADTADRKQNFFCRKLGSPYSDPSQIPVNLEMLRLCVEEGLRLGVDWKKSGRHMMLGVDQMGSFSCATVAEKLPNGKMAIVHVEAIYALDPWARLDEMMEKYGIQIAVVEQLPNIDSSRQFAKRHPGRVFLCTGYGDMEDMVQWGDTPLNRKDFKTDEEFRDQYTVRGDQYRIMSWAFARIAERFIVFPDPQKHIMEIREQGVVRQAPILLDMVFHHYTKTGLIIETDEEQRKTKRKVIKIGLDPHFSFSLMALCMAWFRSNGTTSFILPDVSAAKISPISPTDIGAPKELTDLIEEAVQIQYSGSVCGRCVHRDEDTNHCREICMKIKPTDPGCDMFLAWDAY